MSWFNDHKRQIFLVTGITCSVATPIVTAYCTKKAMDAVDKKGVKDKKDVAKVVAPYAIAPLALTALGTATSVLSYNESGRALSAASTATAALTSLTTTSKIYDDIVKEVVGDKKHSEIEKKVLEKVADAPAKDYVKNPNIEVKADGDKLTILGPTEIVCETGHGDVVFREKWSNQLIRTSWEQIRTVVNDLNARINDGYDVTVNDLLIKLGANVAELGDAYYFPNGIKYMADDDHLYTRDKSNQPLGILEFAMGRGPVPVNKPLARL